MAEILFLAHRAPWPPDRGDRIRSWHLFDALSRLAPVHVAALADHEADVAQAVEKMEPLCASLKVVQRRAWRPTALARAVLTGTPVSNQLFRDTALARHVRQLLATGRISHIVGFSGQMGQFIPPRERFAGRVVMDFVDVDSAKFRAYADQDKRQPLHWVHAREARVLGAYEVQLARRADASLFVSEAEAALFRRLSGLGPDRVRGLDNGIDTQRFDPASGFAPLMDTPGQSVVFTGQMDYRPNIDAVAWFARNVLPAIRARHGDARFVIVGRAPTREVLELAELPGVEVTGEVPDVRPWLASAAVVVAPLLLARGIQNKLLEAMAMARPVVASPAAAEGIDASPGAHLLVAESASAMAAAVGDLLADPARGAAMGAAARARMVARYGWDAQMAPLADLLELAR